MVIYGLCWIFLYFPHLPFLLVLLSVPLYFHTYTCVFKEKLGTFLENQLTINTQVYFWVLSSIPLMYMFILIPGPHCLDYCSSMESFETEKLSPLNLFFFFKIVLTILGLLSFHMNSRIILSISAKQPAGILIELH